MGSDGLRITEHPILGLPDRAEEVPFTFNGRTLSGHEGESIAAALWANGIRVFRRDPENEPRGLYCGVGHCYECRVTVNGRPNVRSCVTPLAANMVISHGASAGAEPGAKEGEQP